MQVFIWQNGLFLIKGGGNLTFLLLWCTSYTLSIGLSSHGKFTGTKKKDQITILRYEMHPPQSEKHL